MCALPLRRYNMGAAHVCFGGALSKPTENNVARALLVIRYARGESCDARKNKKWPLGRAFHNTRENICFGARARRCEGVIWKCRVWCRGVFGIRFPGEGNCPAFQNDNRARLAR